MEQEIKWTGELRKVEVREGDVFILTCEQVLTRQNAEALMAHWTRVMPGTKLMIFDGGAKLGVLGMPTPPTFSNGEGI